MQSDVKANSLPLHNNGSRNSIHGREDYSHSIPPPFTINGLARRPPSSLVSVVDGINEYSCLPFTANIEHVVNNVGASSDPRSCGQPPVSRSLCGSGDLRPLSTLRSAHINTTHDPTPHLTSSSEPLFATTSQAFFHSPNLRAPPFSLTSFEATSNVPLTCTRPAGESADQQPNPKIFKLAAGKRRLGMGRPPASGYPNKKLKRS